MHILRLPIIQSRAKGISLQYLLKSFRINEIFSFFEIPFQAGLFRFDGFKDTGPQGGIRFGELRGAGEPDHAPRLRISAGFEENAIGVGQQGVFGNRARLQVAAFRVNRTPGLPVPRSRVRAMALADYARSKESPLFSRSRCATVQPGWRVVRPSMVEVRAMVEVRVMAEGRAFRATCVGRHAG